MDESSRAILHSSPKAVCVIYFWHQHLFIVPKLRNFRKGRLLYGLISASKDGAFLDELAKWFHVKAIRGSSTWRGGIALQELEHCLQPGCDVIITPDGPKGPRCVCKWGSFKWAWQHRFSVLLLRVEEKHVWHLPSWDRFCIPIPFSTVRVTAQELSTEAFTWEAFQERVPKYL